MSPGKNPTDTIGVFEHVPNKAETQNLNMYAISVQMGPKKLAKKIPASSEKRGISETKREIKIYSKILSENFVSI